MAAPRPAPASLETGPTPSFQLMTAITSWSADQDTDSPKHVGGKAVGLFELPREWVPPFFVVGRDSDSAEALDHLIALSQGGESSPGLIVRSNAVSEETAAVRGAYRSIAVQADAEAALRAIDQVLNQRTRPGDVMLAIVQLAIRPVAKGHLSNERHVAERRTQWVVEQESPSPAAAIQTLTGRDMGGDSLEARVRAEMLAALRHVAFRLSSHRYRVHCEWVWDGRRVWTVQRDTAQDVRGGPVHTYLAARARPDKAKSHPNTIAMTRLDAAQKADWSKLSRPMIFDALGMPTADVWHLSGAEFHADGAAEYVHVCADLEALVEQGPVVIRCDVRAHRGYADLSLPTSGPVEDPHAGIAFMRRTAADHFRNIPGEDWAFLPAVLVPARASIMAQARPGGQRVRLDVLWGYPDGVGLLAHDKWSHDIATDEVQVRRTHKATCLLYTPRNGWGFERVPPPHDWGHTINEAEARIASSWARRLADHVGHEVQLMVLGRINGARGPGAMLPWHYTDHEVPPARAQLAFVPSTGISPDRRTLTLRVRSRTEASSCSRRSGGIGSPISSRRWVCAHSRPMYLSTSRGAS